MTRSSLGVVALLMIGFALLGLSSDPAPGQAANLDLPEKVRFETADGVKIHGSFYRSPVKAAPAVIMVHNIEESSNKEKWIELAKTLQPNFSVLTFDLRGHGASVDIDPDIYFRYPANVRATKGAGPKKYKLDWKEINKDSYSLFVNDIAAAHSYLERTKNELEMCNTQSTIVIGVEQGATLAAIWANSEWYRYKFEITPAPFFQFRPEGKAEGQFLSALVALSISTKLGNQTISLTRTLDFPCKQNTTPIAFVYGDGDPKVKETLKDKENALALEKGIKGTLKKTDTRMQFTKAVEIPKAGKLRGVDLLLKSLGTAANLNDYLKAVVQENPQEWSRRDFVKSKFVWKMSNNPNIAPIPARVFNYPTMFEPNPIFPPNVPTLPLPEPVEKNIAYDTYTRFIAR